MSSHMSGLFEDRPVVLGGSLRSLLGDDSVLHTEVLGAFTHPRMKPRPHPVAAPIMMRETGDRDG